MPRTTLYTSPADAVADVPDGASIMIAGFGMAGYPQALVLALRDRGVRDLTIICNSCGGTRADRLDPGILIKAGMVRKAIVSIGVLPGNAAPEVEEQWSSGTLEVELSPQGTLAERIRAGGAGIGGFYTPVGAGTAVEEGKEKRAIGGVDHLLELPLRADYAFVQAHRADTMGNLVFRRTSRNFNPIMAAAADITIAEAEAIVDPTEIDPERIGTAGVYVDRLVQADRP